MRMQQRLQPMVLLACLVAPPGSALAQDRGSISVLEQRERIEHQEQEERNREREYAREKEWRDPKPTGCQTGQFCSQSVEAIQSHRVPGTALMAVLHDIDVEEDALTVRIRFYNESTEPAALAVDPTAAYDAFYVEVDGEKSFILRDDDGTLEAKESLARDLEPGGMESWWAHFSPLPPKAVSFDLVIPPARFEEVLVSSQ